MAPPRGIIDQVVADYVATNTPVSPTTQGRIVCTASGMTACPVVTPQELMGRRYARGCRGVIYALNEKRSDTEALKYLRVVVIGIEGSNPLAPNAI